VQPGVDIIVPDILAQHGAAAEMSYIVTKLHNFNILSNCQHIMQPNATSYDISVQNPN
jgi:hypothetical protein